jgi:DNA-directed RNA polymerase-3 subunit RPC5
VEVDVPINVHGHYDQEKGRVWGDVLKKAQKASQNESVGKAMASGSGKRRRVKDVVDEEEDPEDELVLVSFDEAVKKGRVLDKQTLGSKIQPDETRYMVGVFRNGESHSAIDYALVLFFRSHQSFTTGIWLVNQERHDNQAYSCRENTSVQALFYPTLLTLPPDQLHLTPIKSTLQLRPQFHHIDAQSVQERAATKALREADAPPPAAAGTRSITLQFKNSDDPNAIHMSSNAKAQRMAEEDEWTKLHWVDQEDDEAWDQYELLCLKDPTTVGPLKPTTTKSEYMDWLSGAMFQKKPVAAAS